MKHMDGYSDEFLNAFIDGQLDDVERGTLLSELREDEALSRRVCQLRKMRDMVQLAYLDLEPGVQDGDNRHHFGNRTRMAIAVSILVLFGLAGGWFSHARFAHQPSLTELAQSVQYNTNQKDPWRLVLHVTTNDAYRLNTVLNETEDLLRKNRAAGRNTQVELVANGKGVGLLRTDTSSHRQRIRAMSQEFESLSFLACQKTLQRLKLEKGISVTLLPDAQTVPSALGKIMQRQQDGWTYIRI